MVSRENLGEQPVTEPGLCAGDDSGSSSDGRVPDFLVIGAAKSGTTSLYNYLTRHPGLFLPAGKEP